MADAALDARLTRARCRPRSSGAEFGAPVPIRADRARAYALRCMLLPHYLDTIVGSSNRPRYLPQDGNTRTPVDEPPFTLTTILT